MSYASQDSHGGGGGGNAEPSMEEILASIRRILKEDEPGKPAAPAAAAAPMPMPAAEISPRPAPAAMPMPFGEPEPVPPADMDDDVLLLDASMIARPAPYAAAGLAGGSEPPAAVPAPPPGPEPLHFSSEPTPFSRDFGLSPRAMPEPVVELPPAVESSPEPLPPPPGFGASPFSGPAFSGPDFAAAQYTVPPEPTPQPDVFAEPEPAAYRPLQPPYLSPAQDETPTQRPVFSAGSAFSRPPEPAIFDAPPPVAARPPAARALSPEPEFRAPRPAAALTPDKFSTEPEMNDAPQPDSFEPPESLISEKTTDAAASSIGALVRSMTTEKSVAISKSSSLTIEDIVREEIRPLLKSWLDSHLPSLVERVVRSEIERVISRSVV